MGSMYDKFRLPPPPSNTLTALGCVQSGAVGILNTIDPLASAKVHVLVWLHYFIQSCTSYAVALKLLKAYSSSSELNGHLNYVM